MCRKLKYNLGGYLSCEATIDVSIQNMSSPSAKVRKLSSQQPRYFMEDGTIGINEPKVENSGIAQGTFLKRSRVLNEDGIPIGPDDMRVGQDLTLHGPHLSHQWLGCVWHI